MTKKILRKLSSYLFFGLFVYLLIGLFLPKASAQQEVYLGVYPPIIQIDATPPTSVKTPLTIQNLSNDPLDVAIQLKPFKPANSYTGTVSFLGDKETFQGEDKNIFDKIELLDENGPISQISLAPKQEKTLTLHVALPKDEPPSDYYFSIVFVSNSKSIDKTTASFVTGGIATNVLLSVGPKSQTKGFLDDFSTNLFFDHGPVNFSVMIRNTSSHFITPRGFIIIRNLFGQAIGKVTLLPVNVLANSDRYIPDANSKQLEKAVWPETFLLGPYSAHLSITLSENGPVFEKTIYFFAMPFQVLIGLLLTIGIVTIIVIRVRKRLQAN